MDNSLTSYKIFVIAAFLFFTGSVLGWVIELFYRKFFERVQNPQRRWVNPGFLTGPWLPVYGIGALALFAMSFVETFISGLDKGGAAHYAAQEPVLQALSLLKAPPVQMWSRR